MPIKRRDLVAMLASAMAFRPFGVAAQQKMPVVGILDVSDPAPLLKEFREGLRDKGYVDGQNIRLEAQRWRRPRRSRS
jgi:putative ABC transport system substrate-binding protein